LNDAGAWTYTSWYDISNTWTGIEVDYHALRTSGSLELMLNGTSKQKITGVDNDTRALTQFRLGAQGVGVNTNGVIYFDEFVSRRFTPIGLLLEADVPMGSPSTQAGWQARTYHYEGAQAHAVTSLTDNTGTPGEYSYDDNGNMTCRVEDGIIYKQVYNAENRISSIMKLAEGTCTSVVKLSMQWDFAYDGDGVRTVTLTTPYDAEGVPQTASLTSYYFGGAYETRSDGSIFKYYTFGGQSIVNEKSAATNNEWKLSYLLTDHLGSVVAVTNGTGALISKQRYLPFGGERTNIGTISQTDYGYTGQREIDKVGLIDYKARFYSSYITQFSQPDSIVPDLYNPQAFNRYSYVLNNPVRYNDPTGHQIACGAELSVKECKTERKLSKISTAGQWKKLIHDDLGITMSDDKHNWDTNNLEIVYFGLAQIDNIFGGKTKSFAEGSVFLLDGKPIGQYSGFTTGRTIIFYTGSTIPFQNLYHEFGHLLDNIFKDSFTNQLKREPHYADGGAYLFGGDSVGIINSNATLKNSSRVGDPNWPYGIASLQHPSGDPVEQWGDMFANYVAGNIDLTKSGGQDMFNTVDGYLKNAGLIP
jgi:RHS repeat-associated protein